MKWFTYCEEDLYVEIRANDRWAAAMKLRSLLGNPNIEQRQVQPATEEDEE